MESYIEIVCMSWKCLGVHTIERGMEGYRCSQVWENAMLHVEWKVIDIHEYVMEMMGESMTHLWVSHVYHA